jgi:hypothetical protein
VKKCDHVVHYMIRGLHREQGSCRRRPFSSRRRRHREEALGEGLTLKLHWRTSLHRELSWILSADMRREAYLALVEGPLTVTARPVVRSGGHSFAESQIFGSR